MKASETDTNSIRLFCHLRGIGAALKSNPVLKRILRYWIIFGDALGWVNTRIILFVAYWALIVPVSIALRITGSLPINSSRFRSEGYWRTRAPINVKKSFKRQF